MEHYCPFHDENIRRLTMFFKNNMLRIFLILLVLNSTLTSAQTRYKSFHFSTDDGLPSNIIYSIAEDNNHNLVLGTDNGFSVFDGNVFRNYNIKEGLNNPYIVSVFRDKNCIWLLNYNGQLQKFQDSKILTTSVFS